MPPCVCRPMKPCVNWRAIVGGSPLRVLILGIELSNWLMTFPSILLADRADLVLVPDARVEALVRARLLRVEVAEAVDRAGLDRVAGRARPAAGERLVDLDLVAAVDLRPVLVVVGVAVDVERRLVVRAGHLVRTLPRAVGGGVLARGRERTGSAGPVVARGRARRGALADRQRAAADVEVVARRLLGQDVVGARARVAELGGADRCPPLGVAVGVFSIWYWMRKTTLPNGRGVYQ